MKKQTIGILLAFMCFNVFSESLLELNEKHFKLIRSSEQAFDYDQAASKFLVYEVQLENHCAPDGYSDVSDMYYEISVEGRVENVWMFPEIKESKCIRDRLKEVTFPRPSKKHLSLENIQTVYH
jgi:hypothetical protein